MLHLHLPCNHPRAPSALQMPPAALAAPLAASAGHGGAADGPIESHRAPTVAKRVVQRRYKLHQITVVVLYISVEV